MAAYNPQEDRILLTIEMQNQQLYLGWITRRFLSLLLPTLHGQHPITGISMFDESHYKMKGPQIKHAQEAVTKLNTPEYPLGESPLLFSKISFSALKTDHAIFVLAPNTGRGIELPFNSVVLNLLLKVLKDPLKQSDWALEHDGIYGVPSQNLLQ
ncbi:MAG: hypothetical protein L3J38_03080 [Thiomicrorhabdus sp.]|nr:hypothetical protein [Thiomicrorhabdus sp.]